MPDAKARPHPRLRATVLPIAAGLGLLFQTLPFVPAWDAVFRGRNDFSMLYVAAHLLRSGGLYDSPVFLAKQAELFGMTNRNVLFIRLPYLALLCEPLGRLPYPMAYGIWQALSLAAFILFVLFWPANRPAAVLACCWFPPLASNFANGQDVTFLLLWMALAVRFAARGEEFAAGLALSLCLAKPHLFLFLPVLLLVRRNGRFAAGLSAGSAVLIAASFLAGGKHWPLELLTLIRQPAAHGITAKYSALALLGSVAPPAAAAMLALLLTGALAVAVYRFARRRSFMEGLAGAAAAGPIVGFHVFLQDYLLALPLVMILVSGALENPPSEAWEAAGGEAPLPRNSVKL